MPAIYGRTHHMLVSCLGGRWKEVHLAMCRFTAYLDDSGTDPRQEVAIATALIIPAARIAALEREWDTLKRKEDFPCFHMSPFSARNPKEGFDWNDDKHERVYRRVREIVKKYGVATVSFAIYKKDYDEVVPPELRARAGKYHYTWAVRHVMDWLFRWRTQHSKYPLEYVFDWIEKRDERRKEIDDVMDQLEQTAPGEFTGYSFRHKEEIPGLQCVDPLAWITYQTALFEFCDKEVVPDAFKGWKDFDTHRNGKWRKALTVGRPELERWVAMEQSEHRSDIFFEAWQQKKEARRNGRQKQKSKASAV